MLLADHAADVAGPRSRRPRCFLPVRKSHWRLEHRWLRARPLFGQFGIEFDHALIMRNIVHAWHSVPTLIRAPSTQANADGGSSKHLALTHC
jgi:hypothetical protein